MNTKFAKPSYIIMLVLIVTLIISGCSSQTATVVEQEKIVPVNVSLSQKEDLPEYQSFPGKVMAVDEVGLSPKLGGIVEQILVKEGEMVKAGQALIILDKKDVINQVNQAQAAYDAAIANLSNLEQGQFPQQLAQLESALKQAEANFNNAKENYERMKELFSEGAIPKQQFEGVELQYNIAKEQYESAKTQLTITKEKTIPESLAAAKAQVKQAEAVLAAAKAALDNCVITSPIDGTVGAITATVGQMASPGYSIITVGNLNSVEIHINVTEDRVNGLKVGQEAEVIVDAASDLPFKGEIVSISPFKDLRTQVYPVKILVPNEKGLLKSGMFARVKLMVALHTDVVTVPEDAVVAYDGRTIVYTLEGDVAKANVVETGPTSMGKTVITKGLESEKEVIIEGQSLLTDGTKVRVEGRGDAK
ncbi:efflux RND transporter periplasmic adaptor subunit [Tepidanaerobacter sp. GT38]|uniref:efflux RND transporter periplasmic adaptor subunit n=1 Tax=Tepidanaerobacter sp. GT38 TaxID=2722793 RepID=UPI001F0196F4|nr:efflux RND transporter periplasmic adaptor subunit [Tepidanaerobacter sp. GT38]MCG1013280.1 efflux RND transporter periplasmic adaptor subunit [Tepidanaerobacter sp. GT38]